MDFPAPQPSPGHRTLTRAAFVAAVLALALYALLLARNVGAQAGGSDSSGYMNHARLLASGHVHVPMRTLPGLKDGDAPPYLYVPLGFRPSPDGHSLVPTYPPGFPLFVAAAHWVVGWNHAGDLAIILHALAGVVATYALGRRCGLDPAWSALAALIVGASPVYLFMSLQAMSDVPSAAWTALAVVAALRASEGARWALLAGFAASVDILLRPANFLVFLPMAVALGLRPRAWAWVALAGVPAAAFFVAHSHAAYGRWVATGYVTNEPLFVASLVPVTLRHYARWIPVAFTPFAWLLAGLPLARSAGRRIPAMLGVWVLSYGAFYLSYRYTHDTWWYLRFLLPAAPALAVGCLLVIRELVLVIAKAGSAPASGIVIATCAALTLASAARSCRTLFVFTIAHDERRYERVADWLRANAPGNAVCLAMQSTGALLYYTNLPFVRWDVLIPENAVPIEEAVDASHQPLYAVLFPFELNEAGALRDHVPGLWRKVGQVEDITLWKREPKAPPRR